MNHNHSSFPKQEGIQKKEHEAVKNKNWPRKLIAICFIILVLVGNVWLHYTIFGGTLPVWVSIIVDTCIVGLVIGGGGWFWRWAKLRLGLNDG